MSASISTAYIASFDAEVKKAYQGSSKLRGTIRTKAGVVGSTHRFPKFGKGLAQQRQTQVDVTPMNVAHTNATATLSDWYAAEYTDVFDMPKTNVDEMRELAGTIAMAMGRREDQLIINALDAASTTLTVSNDVGGTDTNLNTSKVRRAKRLLDDQGVPQGSRTFVHSANGLESLLGDSDASTFDKNAIKALYDGQIMHWVGFDFVMIESRTEGGLAVDGSLDRTNFAYERQAAGLAIGMNMVSEVNYIPQKTSWLSLGRFSSGAVTIDALGLVELTCRETA